MLARPRCWYSTCRARVPDRASFCASAKIAMLCCAGYHSGGADMALNLSGKRVLVTGGNSGLGAAIVRAFAAEQARVAINYVVHPELTEQLAGQLRAGGSEVLALEADVTQADAVQAM